MQALFAAQFFIACDAVSGDNSSAMTAVLSIHSSVTAGFVGNSVAGPVLLSLGVQPLLVDTVMLAAHPGYGRRAGGAVPNELLQDVLDGISDLTDLRRINAMVSGYLGAMGQVTGIASMIDTWRRAASGPYILDPVLGDAGRLYMPQQLVAATRDELLPRADIITPNSFELAHLSGMAVTCRDSAQAAAASLLAQNDLSAVVATGIAHPAQGVGDLMVMKAGDSLWSSAVPNASNVAGGGDLLTSLLAGLLARGAPLEQAFSNASSTAQRIVAASDSPRDLALLENLGPVAALVGDGGGSAA